MLTWIITFLIIISLVFSLCHSMWHLSKRLVIPMQICLFILLLLLLVKTFATKDNLKRVHEEVEKSGIPKFEEKAIKDSIKGVTNVLDGTEKAETIETKGEPSAASEKKSSDKDTSQPTKPVVPEAKKEIKDFTQFL